MPRKPVHLTADSRRPEGRQVIWEAVRRLRRFRLKDVEEATRLKETTIKTYLTGLTNAGYLRRVDEQQHTGHARYRPAWWELMQDVGVDAPRVRKDGTEVTQGRAREQLWRTMRIIGEFNYRELAVQASTEAHPVAESDVKHYCRYLHHAGYLICTRPSAGRNEARYRLVPRGYTGPQPPQIQRVRQVWDPNLQQVVWTQGGGHE
ncbi:hypothetical protein [Alkalilimnicola sp. S0819]|uniref:hypothetical protein n=1 Tax=Alkalilimnicola sp. S0819 TaxID=2613922 RepID=UPI00126295F8|nr:hypothetical protein [Alkalilimnicola sp. S0819]KAB7624352.1 hypothetical protein F3N43_05970 [Alkalilimnicola sp. S0819]MPQ16178.1 hypothetical protein [Alkalilimnicola sp. S0819]